MLVAMLVAATDAKRTGGGEDRPVAQERMHLDLRLDLGSEPVSGELVPPGGPATPFSGYAGLVAALGRICESDSVEATGPVPAESDVSQERSPR
jgi:hypothetical protein